MKGPVLVAFAAGVVFGLYGWPWLATFYQAHIQRG